MLLYFFTYSLVCSGLSFIESSVIHQDIIPLIPVAFIATNHTTGGNSGSPVLDAEGNLIGVNFDRVWEGTMSDVVFDPEVCRNISLDIRFALFVIDKLAGANHLLEEMEILK